MTVKLKSHGWSTRLTVTVKLESWLEYQAYHDSETKVSWLEYQTYHDSETRVMAGVPDLP